MAPREIAIKLMEAVRVGDMSIEKFCSEFETLFNFNWPARDSEKNHIIFENAVRCCCLLHSLSRREEDSLCWLSYGT